MPSAIVRRNLKSKQATTRKRAIATKERVVAKKELFQEEKYC